VHYILLEHWSRRTSFLHRRDARVKWIVTLVFLVIVAMTPALDGRLAAAFVLLAAGALAARLPLLKFLRRASVALLFAIPFALIAALAGDWPHAGMLIVKSYLSAGAVVLLTATTPLPQLLAALESFQAPRFLILVIQFLFRYLFVLVDQAHRMRLAAAARGGGRFRASTGAIGVLFGRSYARAEGTHRAMLSRGFAGRVPTLP